MVKGKGGYERACGWPGAMRYTGFYRNEPAPDADYGPNAGTNDSSNLNALSTATREGAGNGFARALDSPGTPDFGTLAATSPMQNDDKRVEPLAVNQTAKTTITDGQKDRQANILNVGNVVDTGGTFSSKDVVTNKINQLMANINKNCADQIEAINKNYAEVLAAIKKDSSDQIVTVNKHYNELLQMISEIQMLF